LKTEYYFIIPFSDSSDKFLVKNSSINFKIDNKENKYYIIRNNSKSITFNINNNYNDSSLKIALCAIGKNENLYIREWIKWYKNLGINKIYLYDNNEINGERFEDVISDYIKSGFVENINIRGFIKTLTTSYDKDGTSVQGQAYHDCYYNNYKNYDWMLFFDIDEFLSIDYKYNNIYEFLNDFNEYDGIKVQWRMYGDNGKLYYENKPVNKRFKSKNNEGFDSRVKSILKCKNYDFNLIFIAHGVRNRELVIVNLNKKRVKDLYKDDKAYNNLPVYLNHFYTKSTEEFIKRKYKKSSAIFGNKRNFRNFSLDFIKKRYFEYNNIL